MEVVKRKTGGYSPGGPRGVPAGLIGVVGAFGCGEAGGLAETTARPPRCERVASTGAGGRVPYHRPGSVQCCSPAPPTVDPDRDCGGCITARFHTRGRGGGAMEARRPTERPGSTRRWSVPGAPRALIEPPTEKRGGDRGPASAVGGLYRQAGRWADRRGCIRRAVRDHACWAKRRGGGASECAPAVASVGATAGHVERAPRPGATLRKQGGLRKQREREREHARR